MKVYFILSMIICNACYGQVILNIPRYDTSSLLNNAWDHGQAYGGSNLMIRDTTYQRKRDTIKVILLVCDTSWWRGNKMNALGEQFGQVFWRYGYSVREIHKEGEGSIDWYFDHHRPPNYYGVHIYYLDRNKLPLSKNIIVWQSKELQ